MFGRATITLGIGPHSSFYLNYLLQPSTAVNIVTVNRALTFYMDSMYSSLTILLLS